VAHARPHGVRYSERTEGESRRAWRAAVRPPQFPGSAPKNRYGGGISSGVSAGMSFAYGFVAGWVTAWAPGLILLSYLAWKASRDRPGVRTGSRRRLKAVKASRPSERRFAGFLPTERGATPVGARISRTIGGFMRNALSAGLASTLVTLVGLPNHAEALTPLGILNATAPSQLEKVGWCDPRRSCLRRPYYESPPPYAYYRPYPYYNYFYGSGWATYGVYK
jgi:hypothetical protein